jgi:hypothetical protein
MSEYQYFEFQAVDRPLTQNQMSVLRAYSSRAQITSSSFVNVYNWGNFKGNPDKWMEEYFDAFLHLANWGSRWLMLRVPKQLLDLNTASTYCTGENVSCRTKGDHLIVSFYCEEEEYEWSEGEGWLASLVPLRSDLMHGDHRCLYLGWLLIVQGGYLDDDTPEPPVPPRLGNLNAPLRSLADFLRIDRDLIAAAAEQSAEGPAFGLSKEDIARWVAKLSSKDKDAVITRMIEGDNLHIAAEIRQRALSGIRDAGETGVGSRSSGRRSVGHLVACARAIAEERHTKEAALAAREKARRERELAEKRKKHLKSLVGNERGLWVKVGKLIATKQPKRYDEAVALLIDLKDLADMKGKSSGFSLRMSALCSKHTRKTTLVDRFRKAKLLR